MQPASRAPPGWVRNKSVFILRYALTDPVTYTKPWTSAPVIYTLRQDLEPNGVIFSPMD